MNSLALTRRGFLKSALVTGVVGPAFRRSSIWADEQPADAKQAAHIAFGFGLYGMRSLSTADALKACADIGYDCVELVCTKDWPCDPARLSPADRQAIRRQLSDRKLTLGGLMENLHVVVEPAEHRRNLDRLKAAAELGHEVSPRNPPVIETVLGGRPNEWDRIKAKMADGLRDWAKVGQATGTVIAVKPHVGGALHTPEGAKWLVEEVGSPWIRLAYDYSHFQLRGYELEASLKTMIDKTVFVHVKDTKGQAGDFRFLLPGEGSIDYVRYFRLLKAVGYRGPVIVEVSGQIHGQPGYDPIAAARKSYENLAPAFRKAELPRDG